MVLSEIVQKTMNQGIQKHLIILNTTLPMTELGVYPSRYGEIEAQDDKKIYFVHGLPGFDNAREFSLIALPEKQYKGFFLLQNLENEDIAFLTLPLPEEIGLISENDLKEAAMATGCPVKDALFLLVISIVQEGPKAKIYANMRAPIVVDIHRRVAQQYVMINPDYPIRYDLT
ncbi:Flagellar assembly factor FliW [Candidatus Bealeia paramacronuclearis]|uniref:Flagellar assembly factor FliW n=1 Tax=Candidatus Bealeia paramacronuclearis TaxID=1921001 RepID=A0ABZ2C1Z3_9PROT|nr:Flagellar assembly factor FliW [Candidatus Bealeia paramacronuclearis]